MQEVRRSEEETSSLFQAAKKMARRYGRIGIAEPDDLVQTAMLKVLRKSDGRKANLGWLFKVVKNTAMDAGRQAERERRVMSFDGLYDLEKLAGTYLVHEEEAARDLGIDLQPRLKDLFSRLSKPHAQVMLLYLEGHSYEEIADLTGVKKGTVRSRLHHARKQARRLFWDLVALGEIA